MSEQQKTTWCLLDKDGIIIGASFGTRAAAAKFLRVPAASLVGVDGPVRMSTHISAPNTYPPAAKAEAPAPASEGLSARLAALHKHERHHNHSETVYWLNQYKLFAKEAADALEQARTQLEEENAAKLNAETALHFREQDLAKAEAELEQARTEQARLREALIKVRAHTSYLSPNWELLKGLLASIERIADAALASPLPPADKDANG